MKITQQAPNFDQLNRRQNRNYKELLHLLNISPVGTWYAIPSCDVTGPSLYRKQSTLIGCCNRRWEKGSVETHVEGELIYLRRIPLPTVAPVVAAVPPSLQAAESATTEA